MPDKLAAFLLAVDAAWEARWVLKLDDDVYLSPRRLPPVLAQWDRIGAGHTGCFRHGAVASRRGGAGPGEPAAALFAADYPLHAYGSVFGVRGDVARHVLRPNADMLRRFGSDGARPACHWASTPCEPAGLANYVAHTSMVDDESHLCRQRWKCPGGVECSTRRSIVSAGRSICDCLIDHTDRFLLPRRAADPPTLLW